MKKTVFLLSAFCYLLLTCNKKYPNTNSLTIDTLNLPSVALGAKTQINYRTKFGIVIPSDYFVLDSLAIELNNDSKTDTILILSPISLEDESYAHLSNASSKRLLVELINRGTKSTVRKIYDNLISDIGGVLSKYNSIYKTGNGFGIKHESGSRYSWSYYTEFSVESSGSIALNKIIKVCAFEEREKLLEYDFRNISPTAMNISDSIKADCNCEKVWSALNDNDKP